MSLVDFIRFDAATGAFDGLGRCPPAQLAAQSGGGFLAFAFEGEPPVTKTVENGRTFFEVDVDWLKMALCRQIDVACGDMRRRFVTDITGQDATYQLKLAEARRWQSGDDPDDYAYLGREAAKRGVTLAALVAEVLATAALWVETIDPELESSRVAAKKQVLAATSAAQIIAAAQVDWEALLP